MQLTNDTANPDRSRMPVSIAEEKKTIIENVLRAIVLVGFALTAITTIRDIQAGIAATNIIVNSVFLVIMITILVFRKKISHHFKIWAVLSLCIFFGVKVILVNGVNAGTFYFFIIVATLALLLLKRKLALNLILFTSGLYLITISLMAFGFMTPSVIAANVNIKIKWLSEIISYLFVLFIMIGGVGRMQRTFTKSIEELDETNQKLNQSNEELLNQLEQIKAMQRKVDQTEINFKRLFEESNDGIILCNGDGEILECNNQIASLLEYPRTFLIGSKASDFVISDDKRAIDQLSLDKVHRSKIREVHVLTKTGVRMPVEINYSPLTLHEEKALLVTIRDIRERKYAEQKVLNAVIQAEENERSRFAKDLHDDLGPILSSIKMYIQSLRTHEDSEDKKDLINRLIFTVDDSIKSIRRISYNLSSHLLQNMGLINALKTHVDRINLTDSLNVTFSHNFETDQRLASNIEIVIYRVVLELITNSIRHSQGKQINVTLILNNDHLTVNYSDDGIGFDIDRILHDNTKGIGLKNILSRVRSIKGLLNFETKKAGFNLSIDIKL
jgi:PAS domain S-box-containing protein